MFENVRIHGFRLHVPCPSHFPLPVSCLLWGRRPWGLSTHHRPGARVREHSRALLGLAPCGFPGMGVHAGMAGFRMCTLPTLPELDTRFPMIVQFRICQPRTGSMTFQSFFTRICGQAQMHILRPTPPDKMWRSASSRDTCTEVSSGLGDRACPRALSQYVPCHCVNRPSFKIILSRSWILGCFQSFHGTFCSN